MQFSFLCTQKSVGKSKKSGNPYYTIVGLYNRKSPLKLFVSEDVFNVVSENKEVALEAVVSPNADMLGLRVAVRVPAVPG